MKKCEACKHTITLRAIAYGLPLHICPVCYTVYGWFLPLYYLFYLSEIVFMHQSYIMVYEDATYWEALKEWWKGAPDDL